MTSHRFFEGAAGPNISCNKQPLFHKRSIKTTVPVDFVDFKNIDIFFQYFAQFFGKSKNCCKFKVFASEYKKIQIAACISFSSRIRPKQVKPFYPVLFDYRLYELCNIRYREYILVHIGQPFLKMNDKFMLLTLINQNCRLCQAVKKFLYRFSLESKFLFIFLGIFHVFPILCPQTISTWAIPGGQCSFFIRKEYAKFFVASRKPSDCGECGRAIKTPINF